MASRRAGAHTRKQSLEAERLASFLVPLDVDKALRSSSYIIQTLLLFNTNKLIHHLSISSSRIEHPKAFPLLTSSLAVLWSFSRCHTRMQVSRKLASRVSQLLFRWCEPRRGGGKKRYNVQEKSVLQ
jgi:hypothetical protein